VARLVAEAGLGDGVLEVGVVILDAAELVGVADHLVGGDELDLRVVAEERGELAELVVVQAGQDDAVGESHARKTNRLSRSSLVRPACRPRNRTS